MATLAKSIKTGSITQIVVAVGVVPVEFLLVLVGSSSSSSSTSR